MGKYCRGKGNLPPQIGTMAPSTVASSCLMTFLLSFESEPPGGMAAAHDPEKRQPVFGNNHAASKMG
jgi:hypothetical protein